MQIEAAIAQAQSEYGGGSKKAADEIAAKASIEYAPLDKIAVERQIVRHRMVALLNVWRRSLSDEASDALHVGVTTVDIYDTVAIMQTRDAIELLVAEMYALEDDLLALAKAHRDTPMIGRTLGQHALPITFGKKVAVWAAQNRRNIERLQECRRRLVRQGVLRGAVGTHLGLGPAGIRIENAVAERLGLEAPEPADWHGARDVFAEYALALALAAKTYAAIGDEVFRLQMTDIGEVIERRAATAVGSSSMPHKQNPSRSEALVHHGRVIPRLAEVLLDDVVNYFERDNTSRPNDVLAEISLEADEMLRDARSLIRRIEVRKDRMQENLQKTQGMIFSQRIVLDLAGKLGKEEAEALVRLAAEKALTHDTPFREELLNDPMLGSHLEGRLDELLRVDGYLGLAAEQADRTIRRLEETRSDKM